MSHAGALDAAAIGERSAGQGCPLIGIKREDLRILFVSIDNQDSLVRGQHRPWESRGVSDQHSSAVSVAMQQVRNHSCRELPLQGGSGQQGSHHCTAAPVRWTQS